MTKLPLVPVTIENIGSGSITPFNGVVMKIDSNCGKEGDDGVLVRTGQVEKCLTLSKGINHDEDGDVGVPLAGNVDSRFGWKSGNGFCVEEERVVLETNVDSPLHKNASGVSHKPVVDSWVEIVRNVGDDGASVGVREPRRTFSASLLEVSEETKLEKQIFTLDVPPLWGSTSICGRRQEMEDSIATMPRFLKIPSQMLSDNPFFSSLHKDLTGHVFGVYDGHGGCQVAEYCREHLHSALANEISVAKENLHADVSELKDRWLHVFTKCFHRLDDEVGGFLQVESGLASDPPLSPIAPESVGSTAVVAVVCSTHIIVANCGDSRAVLYQGKAPVPLSVDHKPNREDECVRIEAAGGKVINWDGYRVSGVLAVSRSIGDRYLRPYVVADPEVTFIPRTKEDECLILASDGLWDVVTNDEACDLARRRILLWHKKNHAAAATLSKDRGDNIDPAAQDAADYLSKLAVRRGSRDNISVIVVDLKAQRKVKKKS